jgi:hypothetical protein
MTRAQVSFHPTRHSLKLTRDLSTSMNEHHLKISLYLSDTVL